MKQLLSLSACLLIGAAGAQTTPAETYSVRQGDSLSSIAERHHSSVAAIMKASHLNNPHRLKLGMSLVIPRGSAKPNFGSRFAAYAVRKNESLWAISQRAHVDYKTLAHANGLNRPDALKPGTVLRIPVTHRATGSSLPVPKVVKSATGNSLPVPKRATGKSLPAPKVASGWRPYVVKDGDSVWSIARHFQISWKQIAHANGLSKPDQLKLNMKLRIPAGTPTTHVATAPTTKPSKPTISSKWAEATKDRIIVRAAPANGGRVTLIDRWTKVRVGAYKSGWYRVRLAGGQVGWVRGDLLKATDKGPAPQRIATISRKEAPRRHHKLTRHEARLARAHQLHRVRYARASPEAPLEPTDQQIVSTAYEYRGTRYRYGGTSASRGFDCSGFSQFLYRKEGVKLPRTATQQAGKGNQVGRGQLEPGDLVFFHTTRGKRIGHVGMYIGNDKFIHASSSKGRVRVDSLKGSYYDHRFVTARRYSGKAKKPVKKQEPAEIEGSGADTPAKSEPGAGE